VVVTYPFDIMRTQFALQGKDVVYKSMASFIGHTYKTKGVQGWCPTCSLTAVSRSVSSKHHRALAHVRCCKYRFSR